MKVLTNDNIIIVDKNKQPLGFLPKNKVNKLLEQNLGKYRNSFLFQTNKIYKKTFIFYDMYILKIENSYKVSIVDNEKNEILCIVFYNIKNVYLLTKYIDIKNIYLNEIDSKILDEFEDIKNIVKTFDNNLNENAKLELSNSYVKINDEVKELHKENVLMKNEKQLYKIYRYKFYLDANHAVKFNGKLGENHPHTWEFLIELKHIDSSFVLFTDIEKVINEILAPYQGKFINEIEPFNNLNPTTENMGNYFKNFIKEKMNEMNWELLRLEISESPNRTYILREK